MPMAARCWVGVGPEAESFGEVAGSVGSVEEVEEKR